MKNEINTIEKILEEAIDFSFAQDAEKFFFEQISLDEFKEPFKKWLIENQIFEIPKNKNESALFAIISGQIPFLFAEFKKEMADKNKKE